MWIAIVISNIWGSLTVIFFDRLDESYPSPTRILPESYPSPTRVLPKSYASPTQVHPESPPVQAVRGVPGFWSGASYPSYVVSVERPKVTVWKLCFAFLPYSTRINLRLVCKRFVRTNRGLVETWQARIGGAFFNKKCTFELGVRFSIKPVRNGVRCLVFCVHVRIRVAKST